MMKTDPEISVALKTLVTFLSQMSNVEVASKLDYLDCTLETQLLARNCVIVGLVIRF